jgi:hypothetical protein
MPKTLFLFQEDFMTPKFFELEGNYAHLHKTYINGDPGLKTYPEVSADEHTRLILEHEKKCDELYSLIYHPDSGTHKVTFLEPNQPTKNL